MNFKMAQEVFLHSAAYRKVMVKIRSFPELIHWNERCSVTLSFFVTSYTSTITSMLKFCGEKGFWDKICKILWLKLKAAYITCSLWLSVVSYSRVVKRPVQFPCSLILLYEYAKGSIHKPCSHCWQHIKYNFLKILFLFSWFGNRNFYWTTQVQ